MIIELMCMFNAAVKIVCLLITKPFVFGVQVCWVSRSRSCCPGILLARLALSSLCPTTWASWSQRMRPPCSSRTASPREAKLPWKASTSRYISSSFMYWLSSQLAQYIALHWQNLCIIIYSDLFINFVYLFQIYQQDASGSWSYYLNCINKTFCSWIGVTGWCWCYQNIINAHVLDKNFYASCKN